MTVRFHREADAERLKRVSLPRPVAWRLHPDDVVLFAAEGKHCEHRGCRNPQQVNTWRYWRSTEVGRVLLAEHQVCDAHGRAFAERHGTAIEAAPDRSSLTPVATA